MANPGGVTAGNTIEESWGDAVVSRVVGIYASLAAAESDGRTDIGAIVTLTDGTTWIKQSGTALDWRELLHTDGGQTLTGDITIDSIGQAIVRISGAATLPDEAGMMSKVHFDVAGGTHDWYVGIHTALSDDRFAISDGNRRYIELFQAAETSETQDLMKINVPQLEHYDVEGGTLRVRVNSDGRFEVFDDNGNSRLKIGGSAETFNMRVFDDTGTIMFQVKDSADGGSTIEGSPLRGIRTGTAAPLDSDGNDGDLYARQNATASSRGVYIKASGSWVKIADHA